MYATTPTVDVCWIQCVGAEKASDVLVQGVEHTHKILINVCGSALSDSSASSRFCYISTSAKYDLVKLPLEQLHHPEAPP